MHLSQILPLRRHAHTPFVMSAFSVLCLIPQSVLLTAHHYHWLIYVQQTQSYVPYVSFFLLQKCVAHM
jgi:hypothetical protein